MNDFITEENYELPETTSGYFKPKKGDNVFRVLSSAIVGWVAWTTDNKPKRFRFNDKPVDLRPYKEEKISHFWAFIIWDYQTESIQIYEVTQKTIMDGMNNLIKDEVWGSPQKYDIKITREGDSLETRYSISPKPHTALTEAIKQQYEESDIKLENLFTGANPFGDK